MKNVDSKLEKLQNESIADNSKMKKIKEITAEI